MNSPRSNFSLLTGNPQVGRNHHQQLPIGRSNELFLNSLLMKVHINCGGNSRDEYSNTSAPIGKFEPSEEEEEEDRMESTFQTDGNMDQPLDFSRKKDMGGNLDQPKKMMMNGNRNKSKKTKSPLSVSVIPLRSSSHETEDERGEESSSPENSHQSNGINHNGESESNCKSPDHSSPSGCSTTDERAPFMIPGWFQSPNSNYVHDGNSMAANIPLSSPTAIGMNTINNALYSLSNQTAIDAYNTSNGHVSTALFSPDSRRKYTRPFKEYLSNPLNYTRSEQISRLNPIHLQPAASYLDVPGVPERLQQYRQNVFSNRQSNRRERKTSSSNLADMNGSPTGTSEGQVASTSNSDDEKCGLTNGGGGASNNSGSESNMSITPTGCSRSARKRGRPLPDDQKDDAYWERRRKNNEAAKRSRDLRRAKEDEVALRASFFEMENFKLSAEISHLHAELEKQKRLNEELMLKQQRINEEYILKQKLYHGVIPPM